MELKLKEEIAYIYSHEDLNQVTSEIQRIDQIISPLKAKEKARQKRLALDLAIENVKKLLKL